MTISPQKGRAIRTNERLSDRKVALIGMIEYVSTYSETEELFLAHINEDDMAVEAVLRDLNSNFPRIFVTPDNDESWNFLDIGAGNGTKSLRLLKYFISRINSSVVLDVVEPSEILGRKLEEEAKILNLQSFLGENITRKWEDYSPNKQYNFIFSSHSIHAINGIEDISVSTNPLVSIINSLKPNGYLCITVESQNNDINKLRRRFFPAIHGSQRQNGEELQSILNKLGISFRCTKYNNVFFDITDILPEEKEIGRVSAGRLPLLSFLFYIPQAKYQNNISSDMQIQIDRYLLENAIAYSDISPEQQKTFNIFLKKNNRLGKCQYVMSCESDIFWIKK